MNKNLMLNKAIIIFNLIVIKLIYYLHEIFEIYWYFVRYLTSLIVYGKILISSLQDKVIKFNYVWKDKIIPGADVCYVHLLILQYALNGHLSDGH